MRRLLAAGAVVATTPVLCGAAANDSSAFLLLGGLWIALALVVSLPAVLLVHAFRPDWIAAEARAIERRKTACVLIGAGLFVTAVGVIGAVWARNPGAAVLLLLPVLAWFLVGFAGCSLRQGERLTGAIAGTRPLVLGWLARAGAFAVPLLWPVAGVYLVVVALGTPLVALVDGRRPPAAT